MKESVVLKELRANNVDIELIFIRHMLDEQMVDRYMGDCIK